MYTRSSGVSVRWLVGLFLALFAAWCFFALPSAVQDPASSQRASAVSDEVPGSAGPVAMSHEDPSLGRAPALATQLDADWSVVALDAATKRPLAGLDVRLGKDWSEVRRTSSSGSCPVRSDCLEVVISGGGYHPAVAIRSGSSSVVTVELELGATVSGRVVDQDGQPLAEADLQLAVRDLLAEPAPAATAGEKFAISSTSTITPLRTDKGSVAFRLGERSAADGHFVFRGVPPGRHVLHCRKAGFMIMAAGGVASGTTVVVKRSVESTIDVEMARVYVGCLVFDGCSNWPPSSVLQLTRRTYKAPEGLSLVPEGVLGMQAIGVRGKLAGLGSPSFCYFAAAKRGSRLGDVVAGKCVLDVFGRARQVCELRVVPLERFEVGEVSRVMCNVVDSPRSLVVLSPVPLMAISTKPPGFTFEANSADQAHQLFLLPDGEYTLMPKVPLLLRSSRVHPVAVQGDPSAPLATTVFDDVSYLKVTAKDDRGGAVKGGSFMVSAQGQSRGDVILTAAEAGRLDVPCEPGVYVVTYRDDSGSALASVKVDVGPSAVTTCCVVVR